MKNKTTLIRRCKRQLAVIALALASAATAVGQLYLVGTNYSQNFDGIAGGLPAGWTVRTGATAESIGSAAAFSGTPKSWGDTGGNFGNCASTSGYGTNFLGAESATVQAAAANRSLALRQTGSFGDPGAAFVLQIANTIGISNLAFSLDFNMLKVNSCSTVWTVDYAVGDSPAAFAPLGTYSDPGIFGTTTSPLFTLGADADDQAQSVWIRIAALAAATGSGSRDTFGIDNFWLSYSNVNAFVPATPPAITNPPVSTTAAVLSSAKFSVGASGTPPLFYQWYKDGIPLANGDRVSGATGDTLILTGLYHTNAGVYQVVITNAAPSANSVTSSVATTLTVIGFAIQPAPPTNTVAGNSVTAPVNFIDNQTPVTTASGASSNPLVLPDAAIVVAAAGSSGSVTMTPPSGASGVALVTVTASDGAFATNTSFPLIVVPSSDVVFNDHFDYADGSVTAGSLGLWENFSGPANELLVTNGELRVSRSFDEDASVMLIGQPFDTNAVLYSRFNVRFTALPTAIGNYFAHFRDNNSAVGRIWASTANAASGKFRLGIGNANTATATTAQFPVDLELNSNYVVVTRLSLSNGVATLWINPTSETDAGIWANDPATAFNVTAYAFRQAGSEGNMLVDDLAVGTSFASVAGATTTVPLNIEMNGTDVILSWADSHFALQSSTNVTGPYITIPSAASPYTNAVNSGALFFKLSR